MTNRYQTILLFGAPGAGKGTQGAILGAIPGFRHVSSGDIFRSLDPNSELGKIFFEHSSKGELVPDDLTVKVVAENLRNQTEQNEYNPNAELLVLDGIPRNPAQAKIMDELIEVLGVIHLVCRDQEAMVERLRGRALKQNRPDDAKEDVIRRRYEIYENETAPVLEHYDASIIHEIDAMGSPSSVLHGVLGALVPIQDAHFSNPLSTTKA